jgi:hypothetical protein
LKYYSTVSVDASFFRERFRRPLMNADERR